MKIQERIVSGTVLHKLPAEALDIIATYTDNAGLASMRATSRELHDGSAFEFFRRYTSLEVWVEGIQSDRVSGPYLAVGTKSPDVLMAQDMTRSLLFSKSFATLSMSPQNEKTLRKRVSKRIASILIGSLHQDNFMFSQTSYLSSSTGSDGTPLVLKRISALVPQTFRIRKIFLVDLDVNGDDLIKLLETHQRNLQEVKLRKVVLTKVSECIPALSRTEAQSIWLEDIKVSDGAGILQDLTPQSPATLDLLRRLRERNPDWRLKGCKVLKNALIFLRTRVRI